MSQVAIITGAAHRIGAAIARYLHERDYSVVIHYNRSQQAADDLVFQLNAIRADSAISVQADLLDSDAYAVIVNAALNQWSRIDVLVNNASIFHHVPFLEAQEKDWDTMLTANIKSCYFLSQISAPALIKNKGCIVNISDVFAQVPKFQYSIYSLTKAALNSITKSIAQELAPDVRVNAIAPGSILAPNTNCSPQEKPPVLLTYKVTAVDIAQAVYFSIQSQFMTGQIITIDGGKEIK